MNKVIVIVGPTGVGKTKLSIELAKYFKTEIINADSTQIFKNLNIATAKVTKEEQEGIKHHLLDVKEITDEYTVYDYQIDARKCLNELLNDNRTPIMVGGTGLYLKAALYDYKFEDFDNSNNYDSMTNEEIYTKLKELDSNTDIHINNRVRIIKALNYCIKYNKPLSDKEKTDKLLYDTIFIGLTTDRETLYNRINKRVDLMFDKGLLDEALKIYKTNIRTKAVLTPIGYKELFNYFDHLVSLEETKELIKQKSRKYAKRQYTWFNNQMNINWFNANFDNFDETVEEVINYIKTLN